MRHIPRETRVVREYVDAFRSLGLEPALYYSVWDTTQGVGEGPILRQDIDFIKAQLSELLTGYGPIPFLMFDGWSWSMGHQAVAYDEIRVARCPAAAMVSRRVSARANGRGPGEGTRTACAKAEVVGSIHRVRKDCLAARARRAASRVPAGSVILADERAG